MKLSNNEKYTQEAIDYAQDLVKGNIVSHDLTRKAAQRFLDDLQREDWKWRYDPAEVKKFCAFAEYLRQPSEVGITHIDNKINLMPWQIFAAANIFGFKDKNGFRRFRDGLIFIPRRNGKSTFMAIFMWYITLLGGVVHPRVFNVATEQGQAAVLLELAEMISDNTPNFASTFHPDFAKIDNLPHIKTNFNGSKGAVKTMIPGKNVQAKDGRAADFVICDEIHAYRTPREKKILNSMRIAIMGKPRGLRLMITTAGDIKYAIGFDMYAYARDILLGKAEEDRFFSLIYQADEDDDPTDEETWIKANPSYGITIEPDEFRMISKKALSMNSADELFEFVTKNLNIWLQGTASWLDQSVLQDCVEQYGFDSFTNEVCCIGVDLSAKNDITSYCLTFKTDEGTYKSLWRHWITERELDTNTTNADIYKEWKQSGAINISQAAMIDFNDVFDRLREDIEKYNVQSVLYDRKYAIGDIQKTEKEFPNVNFYEYNQGTPTYDPTMSSFEGIFYDNMWKMNDDPVALWCLGNIAIRRNNIGTHSLKFPNRIDNNDNFKIDAGVAMLMSFGSYFLPQFKLPKQAKFRLYLPGSDTPIEYI